MTDAPADAAGGAAADPAASEQVTPPIPLGTTNLALAATQPSDDNLAGGCGPTENKDGDHYFCAPAAADLEPIFVQVADAAVGGAHLVD